MILKMNPQTINAVDNDGLTALHVAVVEGHEKIYRRVFNPRQLSLNLTLYPSKHLKNLL